MKVQLPISVGNPGQSQSLPVRIWFEAAGTEHDLPAVAVCVSKQCWVALRASLENNWNYPTPNWGFTSRTPQICEKTKGELKFNLAERSVCCTVLGVMENWGARLGATVMRLQSKGSQCLKPDKRHFAIDY
jgi:hypothetical protein